MLVVGGHADAFGDGGEGQEVAGRYGAVFLRMVLVEVDDPLVTQPEGAGSFGIGAAEGRGGSGAGRGIVGGVEWAVGRVAEDAEEVAEPRLAVVLDDEDIVLRSASQQIAVDAVEPGVIIALGGSKGLEVACCGVPHAVATVGAQRVGSGVGARIDLRRPDDQELPLLLVVEKFGSPDVVGRDVAHHVDDALLRPMYQVGRRGIAETAAAHPLGGPDEVERTIRPTDDAGVAHHTLVGIVFRCLHLPRPSIDVGGVVAHHRPKPDARQRVPMQPVEAIKVLQTLCGGFAERGEDVGRLFRNGTFATAERHHKPDQGQKYKM